MPYAPQPTHNAAPPPEGEDELAHLNPTLPKVAAGFTLLAGALAILNGVQTLTSVHVRSLGWSMVPWLLMLLGGALVYFAKNTFTARSWAAVGVLAVGSVLVLASAAWLYFAVNNGFIALYAIWTPMGALLAVLLCAASIPACDRATRARQALAAQGMSIGL